MVNQISIYGASGHGKVIADCIRGLGIKLIGYYDDDDSKIGVFDSTEVKKYKELDHQGMIICGIGNNSARMKLVEKIKSKSCTIVHPSALVHSNNKLGSGTVVFHSSTIQIDTNIGIQCIINTSSSIDHDCIISDYVHIGPNSTLCGGVSVGEGALIGAGVTIIPNMKIGHWATIGAGSVIIQDVPDYATVLGNPGKVIKFENAK